MTETHLDLKICEGCGALWLRAAANRVYCRRCAPRMAEMPPPRGLRRNTPRSATGSGSNSASRPAAGSLPGSRFEPRRLRLVATTHHAPANRRAEARQTAGGTQ